MEPSSEGVMPDEIQGRITTAFLKNGMPLCSAFQMKSCPADGATCTKLHKCAVVLRTGRACGGSHPACECRDKHAVKAEVESPSPKPTPAKAARLVGGRHPPGLPSAEQVVKKPAAKPRPRVAEPQSANPTATGSRAPVQEPCREDQEEHFDNLAGGGKRAAEPPTMIYSNQEGGQLWLAGIPRQQTLHQYPPSATLQIVCFSQEVEQKGGICLPGALLLRVCPASKRDREGQWKISWPTIRNTLQAGETAVLHCVAGRHRAAGLGVLLRAILMDQGVDEAASWIRQRRNIDMASLFKDPGVREWIHSTRRSYSMVPPFPETDGFMATLKSHVHLKTVGNIPLCAHKQSAEKATQRLVGPIFATEVSEAKTWNKPLCQACYYRSPASTQMKLRNW